MKKTVLASAFALTLISPLVVSANQASSQQNPTPTLNGETKVAFKGTKIEDGGLVFNSVPSFDFKEVDLKDSGYSLRANGIKKIGDNNTQGFEVTDLRGGDSGYKIKMNVNDLQASNTNTVLPVQNFLVSCDALIVQDIKNQDIKVFDAIKDVNVFKCDGYVVKSTENANGKFTSGTPSVVMNIAQANIKASTYTGTIQYVLEDGGLIAP